jgi:ribosomal protein S18 acetylase RimI-like enzyme
MITTYEGQVPSGLVISPHVQYLLTAPAPHLVWWLAVHSPSVAAVGGLKVSLHSGRTGRDILGESVVIEDLSVAPSHQRLGIGTALIQTAEIWISSRPDYAQTISLGVESDNTIAIALYNKMGYTTVARAGIPITFPDGNGHPCNVMSKRLNATAM